MMLPAMSENRLQLVPNWNGITMPDTTPMPKEMAKIRSQNCDRLIKTGLRVKA